MFYSAQYHSPFGEYIMASDGTFLLGLWRKGQKFFGQGTPQNLINAPKLPIHQQTEEWLDRYFAGEKPSGSLPLKPAGSDFRQRVWDILLKLPYGGLTSYKEIAARLKVLSAQAVGGAVGHNPISIIIPCHRVIGTDGSLVGYAGGITTKIKLLEHEGVDLSKLYIPKKGTAL